MKRSLQLARAAWIGVMLAAIGNVATVWADATAILPTPFAGRVTQIVYGPSSQPDGVILEDHTLLEFPSVSLVGAQSISVGDQLSGTGIQVLSAPNRVFDRVALMRGSTLLFDDSKMTFPPAPPLSGSGGGSALKLMFASAPLLAVGSTPDGQADRLILANGNSANGKGGAAGTSVSYVQVPSGAYLNPRSLDLGEPIAIQGAGTQFQNGSVFIHAFTAQAVGGSWLFRARGYDGEQWMLKQGSIKQALVTPAGLVDGVLLSDNTAIFFTAVPANQVANLLPGVLVRAAGPGVRNRMDADSLLLIRQNRFVSLVPTVTDAGPFRQMAGEVPSVMIPMKDRARVEAVFKNDRKEIDTIVLADRTRIWVPPRLRRSLPRGIARGQFLEVIGRGGNFAMGTALEADQIKTGLARAG